MFYAVVDTHHTAKKNVQNVSVNTATVQLKKMNLKNN